MTIEFLIDRFASVQDELAIATPRETISYGRLLAEVRDWQRRLESLQLPRGSVVTLEGEYGLAAIAAFLALVDLQQIVVPLTQQVRQQHGTLIQISQAEWRITLEGNRPLAQPTGVTANHDLYDQLRAAHDPGLVLFTSGSTGASKGAVHSLSRLLEKFRTPRQRLRSIVFLLLDHIGGVNTLLYTLSNGGAVIVPADRSPASVCAAVAKHRAELLPTSPTFLNLLLLSRAYEHHDLTSLKLITYGTEPMPESTLQHLNEVFPQITLQQTYGMTELGILRSKSRDSRSLWVRLGGDGFDTKVVDGRLWVRAQSAMLGYLNAPSPFDSEGYLDTGDLVETDGEWLRILGRASEIINVGGNKVHPVQVESALLQMEGVVDAVVSGETHPIMNQIVTATVSLAQPESSRDFRLRMRQFCLDLLPSYAIPVKVYVSDGPLHTERYKRKR